MSNFTWLLWIKNSLQLLHFTQHDLCIKCAYRNAANKKIHMCPTVVKVLCRRSCNSVCSILGRRFRVARSENSFDIWPSTVQNDYWSPKTAHGTSPKPYPARFLIIVSVIGCIKTNSLINYFKRFLNYYMSVRCIGAMYTGARGTDH